LLVCFVIITYGKPVAEKSIVLEITNLSEPAESNLPLMRGDNGERFNFLYYVAGEPHYFFIPPGSKTARYEIQPDGNIIEVLYLYKNLDKISYFLAVGDTSRIKIQNGVPYASVYNGLKSANSLDVEMLWRHRVAPGGYLSMVKLKIPQTRKSESITIPQLEQRAHGEISTLNSMLDSLIRRGELSAEIGNMYKVKYAYLNWCIGNQIAQLEDDQLSKLLSDKLINFDFFRKFVFVAVSKKFGTLSKLSTSNTGVVRDDRPAYDAVVTSSMFRGSIRDMILAFYMKSIVRYVSVEEADKYLKRFASDVHNKELYQKLVRSEGLERSVSDDVELEGIDGEKSSLSKQLKRWQGRPVYIDCWATWCAPCMASMPASGSLVKQFLGKPVIFVYLSFDQDTAKWKEKVNSLNIPEALHFRVTNLKRSKMLDQLNIPPIPRYLLYDKNALLKLKTAPTPSDRGIVEILNREMR